MASNPEQDFVLKTIKSRDVHFVRFWFTDVLGSMKSFAVIPSELEDAFADGMGFDGSCLLTFCVPVVMPASKLSLRARRSLCVLPSRSVFKHAIREVAWRG